MNTEDTSKTEEAAAAAADPTPPNSAAAPGAVTIGEQTVAADSVTITVAQIDAPADVEAVVDGEPATVTFDSNELAAAAAERAAAEANTPKAETNAPKAETPAGDRETPNSATTAATPQDEKPAETPSQTFSRRIRELRAELTAGNISIEIFREAEAIAAGEFKASQPKPFGLDEPPKPEAAEAAE